MSGKWVCPGNTFLTFRENKGLKICRVAGSYSKEKKNGGSSQATSLEDEEQNMEKSKGIPKSTLFPQTQDAGLHHS